MLIFTAIVTVLGRPATLCLSKVVGLTFRKQKVGFIVSRRSLMLRYFATMSVFSIEKDERSK